jgi:thiamine biosynthesis lipoprotein
MRQVAQIMGMPIAVDIPGCSDMDVFRQAFERLQEIDNRYSTYKAGSELSRFQRGEINEPDLSAEFKKIIKQCQAYEKLTEGYFSAYFSGIFDPTGLIKGWALARAGKIIENSGYKTYCIGAGGDIIARSDTDKIWNIGIQHPERKSKIIDKIAAKNVAVATSGNYERGKHIVNPKTGKLADKLLSVSVIGPDIILADVLATAIFAKAGLNSKFYDAAPGYKFILVDKLYPNKK